MRPHGSAVGRQRFHITVDGGAAIPKNSSSLHDAALRGEGQELQALILARQRDIAADVQACQVERRMPIAAMCRLAPKLDGTLQVLLDPQSLLVHETQG